MCGQILSAWWRHNCTRSRRKTMKVGSKWRLSFFKMGAVRPTSTTHSCNTAAMTAEWKWIRTWQHGENYVVYVYAKANLIKDGVTQQHLQPQTVHELPTTSKWLNCDHFQPSPPVCLYRDMSTVCNFEWRQHATGRRWVMGPAPLAPVAMAISIECLSVPRS